MTARMCLPEISGRTGTFFLVGQQANRGATTLKCVKHLSAGTIEVHLVSVKIENPSARPRCVSLLPLSLESGAMLCLAASTCLSPLAQSVVVVHSLSADRNFQKGFALQYGIFVCCLSQNYEHQIKKSG